MKRRNKNVEEFMLRHLGLFKTPPQQEMDLAEARIENQIRTAPGPIGAELDSESTRHRWKLNGLAVAFGTAALVSFAFIVLGPYGLDADGAVATGSLFRMDHGKTEVIPEGEKVEAGTVVTAGKGNGSIEVSDSRVEISDESKLSWERADDGVRVHLSQGSVIVNAKTGTRRLYVHTKDLMAGGAGSAFLVVAEETGSRVAVIHGDVRVQQGATEKVLHAGEQFATNPAMEKLQIKEAISWSRNAEAYVAFLTEVEPAIIPALAPQERTTFEIISIRPSTPFAAPGGGGRGTAGGGGGNRPERSPERDQIRANSIICGGAELDVNPGRFVLTGGTVYRLVILAYGLNECSLALQNGKVSGGPEWARSERFDIQATIPAGTPPYTRQQLNAGEAPKLQLMIQDLLSERFKISLRRETKEMPGFDLVVAKTGKIKLSEDQTPPPPVAPGTPMGSALPRGVMRNCAGNAISMSSLAMCLQRSAGGNVVDKTNLSGLYDIPLSVPDPSIPTRVASDATTDLLDGIGLKLEPTKVPGEVLIIESVERPTEN